MMPMRLIRPIGSNKFLTTRGVINKVAFSFAVRELKQREIAFTVLKKEI
jgi:hypothetical protein